MAGIFSGLDHTKDSLHLHYQKGTVVNLGGSLPGSFAGSTKENAAGKATIRAEQHRGTENKIIDKIIVQSHFRAMK